jgi:hypothetical protein
MTSILYLVNGDNGGSEMCSYDDVAKSLNGQQPDGIGSVSAAPAEIIWEGNSVTGAAGPLFPQFTTHINADAASQAQGAQVGTATVAVFAFPPPGSPPDVKAYHIWNIFKDSGRVLYNDPNLGDCHSLYWCTDVSFLFQAHVLMADAD